ncbi:hypothetical protein P167DRAFT_576707 [Morchella conica CCBAS932]|uniref:Uncharacterized protein n=1 Tax=Morchella conica CCBAS932 TaxID=1392247 RepID=A0A3N4KNZ9_9PEZI|nr:hypothetical protein P167DRAFT_576707 [Morchella conica CCBAS932]
MSIVRLKVNDLFPRRQYNHQYRLTNYLRNKRNNFKLVSRVFRSYQPSAPSSQNGFDNSGYRDHIEWQTGSNEKLTLGRAR